MSKIPEKLLDIVCSKGVSLGEVEFFEENVEDFPILWETFYLWSVENENYQLSQLVLDCGLKLIDNSIIRKVLIDDFGYNKDEKIRKILHDGFVIDGKFFDDVLGFHSKERYWNERLYKELFLENRVQKIMKVKQGIHRNPLF
jgi:hypothetical protein